MMILNWLLDLIPWWIWVPLAAGALFTAYRFLGLRGLMAAGGAVALWFAYIFGRKSGGEDARAKQERERQKARDVAKQVENNVGAMPADKRREELKKWQD